MKKQDIKCVLVDDELDNLLLLEYMLQESTYDIFIQEMIQDPQIALEVLKESKVDVVFLDIQMPGLSGLELLNSLETWNFHVVFVTAYDQFAIQALRLSAFDYILKPINQKELERVLSRLVTRKNYENNKELENNLQNFSNYLKKKNNKKLLPGINDFINLDLDEIIYFEADSIFSWAIFKNGQRVCVNVQMKQLEEDLQYNEYFRIHRSYLINLNEISKVSRKEGIIVIMSNGNQISVSRSKKAEFFKRMFDE